MPKKPDVLCAGTCGRLIWSGSGCLPPGKAMCRACRAVVRSNKPRPPRAGNRFSATCETCSTSYRARTRKQRYCSVACRNVVRREQLRPGRRAKNHQRRTKLRMTDVTVEYEETLRRKAKTCPLCKVRLVSEPLTPRSKELDHILPINVGGTHTVGNVRIMCRLCNQRRPKDGSDYTGQLTLWAEDATIAAAQPAGRRPCLCPCGARRPSGRDLCYSCKPRSGRTPAEMMDLGRVAAKMRADGVRWQEISDQTGIRNVGNTHTYATKYGDASDIARWPRYVRAA